MASVNKVILVGNLGKDPELRSMDSGSSVCNIRLATTRSWKDKTTGEKKEETEWHSVVFYDRLAEIAGEYLKKGRSVYVEGRLKTRKWQDKDGQDRYTTEIVATEMQLLGSRDSGDSDGDEAATTGARKGGSSAADYARERGRDAPPARRPTKRLPDDELDSVPF